MSFRLIWIFCLIAVGAGLTLSFLNQRETKAKNAIPPKTSHSAPTVSFGNIEMIINSPDGQPQYELSSPKYWLYHKQKRSEFVSPEIVIYNKNGSKIYATSEMGTTHNENEVITLIGNVKIKQPSSEAASEPLSIYTEKLTVSKKYQQVTTELPVTATYGSQKITAVGMTLNLNDKVVYLHSNVKGQYNP